MSAVAPWKRLVVKEPWTWALINGGKPIENRQRKDGRMPTICRHRGPLIIQGSKGMSKKEHRAAAHFIHATFGIYVPGPTFVESVWQEQAKRAGRLPYLRRAALAGIMFAAGHVEPDGTIVDYTGPALDMRWHARGSYGLILLDPVPLPWVPASGGLGLVPTTDEDLGAALAIAQTYAAAHR